MKKKLILSHACSARGAQMGRPNVLPCVHDAPVKLYLEKLAFVDGDYDRGGAYWGGGSFRDGQRTYIYCGWDENGTQIFVRAKHRYEAKDIIREDLPNAKFYA